MNRLLKNTGFTLIEMMVVVVIFGILAAIALPLYNKYIQDGRIEEGKALLMNDAQYMQRQYLDNGSYASAEVASLPSAGTGNKYYLIGFSGDPDDTTFEIAATPTEVNTAKNILKVDQDSNIKSCDGATSAATCSSL